MEIPYRQLDIYVWTWGRGWGYKFGVISILMVLKTRRLDEITREVSKIKEEKRKIQGLSLEEL